jgi:hypothetical protein
MSLEVDINNFLNTPSTNFDHTIIDFMIRIEARLNNTTKLKKEFRQSGATTVNDFMIYNFRYNRDISVEEDYDFTVVEQATDAAQDYDLLITKVHEIMVSVYLNNTWWTKCSNVSSAISLFDNKAFTEQYKMMTGRPLIINNLPLDFKIIRSKNLLNL